MKHKLKIITTAAASLMTFAALAQNTATPKMTETESTHLRTPQARADRLNGAAKASDIIGMTVKNYQDEKLGKVEDLAVDVESGRIIEVILSTGGFLGIGDTLSAVPPGALHHDVANKVLHLDANKEKLSNAPKFDMATWDAGTQSNRVTEIYSYYGERPYFSADQDTSMNKNSNMDSDRYVTQPRNMDGTINTDGSRMVEKVRNAEIARNTENSTSTNSIRNPDGTWTRRNASVDRTKSSWSQLGFVEKASTLIGFPVKNMQDEKLGKVENFMVDIASGRIVAVIISSGGFMGMGDELSAVPPTALRFNAERNTLQLDASKEMLANSPHFKANQWPDLSQPAYAGEVYRAYKVEPYFTSDKKTIETTRDVTKPTAADNTRMNVRDRDSKTLTPLNQGTSKADIATTAQIRKEIIAVDGMSTNGKNVKIITIDGQVTLRGPVNTAEEKTRIGEIAIRIAQAGHVDNQLEVNITTTSN